MLGVSSDLVRGRRSIVGANPKSWYCGCDSSSPLLFCDIMVLLRVISQSDRRHGQNERCTCPDPSAPLAGTSSVWKTYHNQLVLTANQYGASSSTNRLDIVFLGDAIVERWQGTSDLGLTILAKDMKEPFQSRFVKKNGADLEGVALGASSDTVSLCLCKNRGSLSFWVTHLVENLPVCVVGTQFVMAHSKRND